MKPVLERIKFDWETVHRRMAKVKAAAESALRHSPEHAREIMDERARALAQVPNIEPDAADVIEVVTFRRGSERYALESRYAHEVFPARKTTAVPGTPEFVVGVTNLRGEVLAIFDLCKLLGVAGGEGSATQVLVVGDQRPEFGILADAVEDVLTLRVHDLRGVPPAIAAGGRDYFRGVTRDGLMLLAGDALLHDPRLIIVEDGKEMLSSAGGPS